MLVARSDLLLCSRASCPAAIQADCVDWLEEVMRSLPSVVVTAHARGRDVANVKVSVDGKLVAESLSGAALEVDPGQHVFHFESAPWPPVERAILVSESVKGRAIDIEFAPPLPDIVAPRAPDVPHRAGRHAFDKLDHALGAGAAAGLVTAGVAGGWGLWSRHHLEESCAPFCRGDQKSAVHDKLVVADVALGVAVVSLVVLYLHVTRPLDPGATASTTPAAAPRLALLVGGAADAARVGLGGAF